MQRVLALVVVVGVVGVSGCDRKAGNEPEPKDPEAVRRDEPVIDAGRPRSVCNAEMSTFCDGENVVECTREGQRGNIVQTCKAGCKGTACLETCGAKGGELVYVVESEKRTLYSFDPRKLPNDPFERVGVLDCPTSADPFSMAIDNHGVAWVLYSDKTLFRASILDGRCVKRGMTTQGAPALYGMGFAKDTAKGETEKLFVSDNDDDEGNGMLATVDISVPSAPKYTAVGKIAVLAQDGKEHTVNPEMTGTADARLFGYFPEPVRGSITELDKKTGKAIGKYYKLSDTMGEVDSYAFAHWGGTFYLFTSTEERTNAIHAVDRKTGAYKLVMKDSPHRIVGAGVSTCAPLVETPPSP
jgi:hypothetical protein